MSDDKKVNAATFTQIQNNLVELHDKLFPEVKCLTQDDFAFLHHANKKKHEAKQKIPDGSEVAMAALLEEIEMLRTVVASAYELRHIKFGREYKKACVKFDKLYEELNKTDRPCQECKGNGLPTRKHSDLADKCEDCSGTGYVKEKK
jgi:hypothetical protein